MAWVWELRVMTARDAIDILRTVEQGGNETFRARAMRQAQAQAFNQRALAIAAGPIPSAPILVSAHTRATFGGTGSPDDLIVMEGNHRMLAIAIRASWGWPLPRCIGVFVR